MSDLKKINIRLEKRCELLMPSLIFLFSDVLQVKIPDREEKISATERSATCPNPKLNMHWNYRAMLEGTGNTMLF